MFMLITRFWIAVSLIALISPISIFAQTEKTFLGLCDASALVFLDEQHFVVADDEDSDLRIYSINSSDYQPIKIITLNNPIKASEKTKKHINKKKSKKTTIKRSPEFDLEGAAKFEDHIFWLASHGNNSKGEIDVRRQQLIFTKISKTNSPDLVVNEFTYLNLIDDLIKSEKFKNFNFAAASKLPPKTFGALNIEGLTFDTKGVLWLGFRNPIINGKAILISITNPFELLKGSKPAFGDYHLIDLEGKGFKSLAFYGNKFLIVAGAFNQGGDTKLYWWQASKNKNKPVSLNTNFPKQANIEALEITTNNKGTLIYGASDDGALLINGKECKKLKTPKERKFRLYTVTL